MVQHGIPDFLTDADELPAKMSLLRFRLLYAETRSVRPRSIIVPGLY